MKLNPQDFYRLERNGSQLQSRGGNLFSNDTNWARYFTRKSYKLPIQIDIYARIEHFHSTGDDRPYDGLSFLWGNPTDPNDTNYNINLLRRVQGPNRWHEERNHKYQWKSPESQCLPWQKGEWRLFQIHIGGNDLVMMSDGIIWRGQDFDTKIPYGKIGLRADRCIIDMRVEIFEGTNTMVNRIAGTDRYSTSAAASRALHPNGCDTVYLVTGEKFPDAVTGGQFGGKGAMLLVSKDILPESIKLEIQRLKPKEVIAIGGTGVISDAVLKSARKAAGLR